MKETPTLYQLGALVSQQTQPGDIAPDDWPEIVYTALQHGLAPVLLWTTKQAAPDLVGEPLWAPVIAAARSTGLRYVAFETSQQQVNAALEAAHVPALWIKGIALARTVYPQPALRSMGDLDVLVPYEQRDSALQVVEGLGYQFPETDSHLVDPKEAVHLNLTYHSTLRGGLNGSVVLELHFRLLSTDNALLPLDKLAWFWTQTTTPQNGTAYRIPQPEAHLLYLAAHAILQHGEGDTWLRQYFDLHQIVTQSTIDWDKVVTQSAVLGWNYAVERALALAVSYFATPVPPSVFTALRQTRPPHDLAAERAIRFNSKGSRWEKLLVNFQEMSWSARLVLIRRLLLPPREYMRIQYHLRPQQRVWPYYVVRWLGQAREIGWATWNRARRALTGRQSL